MLPKVDNPDGEAVARQERVPNEFKPGHTTPMTDSSTDAPAILFFKAARYSPDEIDDLQRAIHSLEQVVLPARKKERLKQKKSCAGSKENTLSRYWTKCLI